MYLFINIIVFVFMQIYLHNKGNLKYISTLKFRYVILLSIVVIICVAKIGVLLNIGNLLVVIVIAITSSIIMYSFQRKIENSERRMQ